MRAANPKQGPPSGVLEFGRQSLQEPDKAVFGCRSSFGCLSSSCWSSWPSGRPRPDLTRVCDKDGLQYRNCWRSRRLAELTFSAASWSLGNRERRGGNYWCGRYYRHRHCRRPSSLLFGQSKCCAPRRRTHVDPLGHLRCAFRLLANRLAPGSPCSWRRSPHFLFAVSSHMQGWPWMPGFISTSCK